MSRSRKKTPVISYTCSDSEKDDKRIANRKLRRAVKVKLQNAQSVEMAEEMQPLPELREVSDTWTFAKDGKIYIVLPDPDSPQYDKRLETLEDYTRK